VDRTCIGGSGGCQEALDTAARTGLNLSDRARTTVAGALMFPGTFLGGPVPSSRNDLVGTVIQNRMIELAQARAEADRKKAQEEAKRREEERRRREEEEKRRKSNPGGLP